MTKKYSIEFATHSDVGIKRKQNQDLAAIVAESGLFILADGMGGHQGGETASKICIDVVSEFFKTHSGKNTPDLLQRSIDAANESIFQRALSEPNLKGMGTTATILKLDDQDIAHIAQVGDSRCYYWNSQGIWQITMDHSVTQEKLRAGLISRDQLKYDEMKNVITRSVGYEPIVKVDLFQFATKPGDGFLLCSDGLSNPLSERLMFDILEESLNSGLSLDETAKQLVRAANERGGDDNVTLILLRMKQ